jgi:prepilin-type N-terminal cleavage/methylation domain-containing protein
MSALERTVRDQRGFTLAELLVVMALTGLVLAGVFSIQQQGTNSYLMGAGRVETQQNARVALDLMTRELRSAKSVTALGSATDITFVTVMVIGGIPTDVTVRYELVGNTLNRTEAGVGGVLIGGVQSLTFTYYATGFNPVTNTGPTTTVPADLKAVRIQIITRPERPAGTGSPGDQRATVESTVMLRNG